MKRLCFSNVIRSGLVLTVLLLAGGLGCGNEDVLGPEAVLPDTDVLGIETGAPLQTPSGDLLLIELDLEETVNWLVAAAEEVLPGTLETVTGSRYSVTFDVGSLRDPATITIKERDPGIVDVELGPDGLEFDSPVVLEIDYSGTANDPSSPDYHGLPPRLFWFNPKTSTWKVVPGTDDPKTRTYRAPLRHFSRYAMGDGAGWDPKGGGNSAHTDEIQWH
jgi:hypothetical protein